MIRKAVAEVDATVLMLAEQQQASFGTTAVFALPVNQHILISHLGDSKAVMCQQLTAETAASDLHPRHDSDFQPKRKTAALDTGPVHRLQALPLTDDHSPDRSDERDRVVAAGGSVTPATAGHLPCIC